jgi:hypothetical protein
LSFKHKENVYFRGKVYKAHWLVDSVKDQFLHDPKDYLAFEKKDSKGGLTLLLKNHTPYTITEAIKIFDLALNNKTQARGASFWKKIEDDQIIPKRTSESMRSFWKQHSNQGLEIYLKHAIENQ